MDLDALLLVSNAQAAATAAAHLSTSSIDLGDVTPKRQVGTGEPIGFAFTVDVAADVADGTETYLFEVVQADDDALTSNLEVLVDRAIDKALLVAGFSHFLAIPQGLPTRRFIGVRLTLGGDTPSITWTAWLTTQSLFSLLPQHYAKGYAV